MTTMTISGGILADAAVEWRAERARSELTRPAKAPRPANDHEPPASDIGSREEDGRQPEAPAPNGPEDYYSTAPAQPKVRHVVTEALRSKLLVSSWLTLDLPRRDYLLGDLLCTTSRWLIFGETGVGKTLLAMDLGGAVASGQGFLNWVGRRRSRVMFIDGELPAETFKERVKLIAERCGPDIPLWGYSRDVLSHDDMQPLNTPEGVAWLMREIEVVKPDLIILDSVMCLLAGNMSEEESWAPVKLLMRRLSARRIAQIWLHHAGHDATKGFGTKTREWEMDTVIALLKADQESDDGSIRLEFRKARLRTPATASQFAPQVIRLTDSGWSSQIAPTAGTGNHQTSPVAIVRSAYLATYDRLADGIQPSAGFDGASVRKVAVDAIGNELRTRGFLQVDASGSTVPTSRTHLWRAKADLLSKKVLIEADGFIWRGK
jgi:hypothetical protein